MTPIANVYLISDVDDLQYVKTGFVIVKANKDAEIVNSLTVQTTHGGVSVKLTPKRVFGSLGVTASAYLTYSEVINEKGTADLANGNEVLQFWVTPDNVFVTGTASRQYKGLASKNDVGLQSESAVVSTYSEYSGS